MDNEPVSTEIQHAPLVLPRPDVIGEVVMHQQWLRQVRRHYESHDGSTIFDVILWNNRGKAGQREATVCATFMVWLGSNNGRDFLDECRNAHKLLRPYMNGFLAAWVNTNSRDRTTGNGCTQMEMIFSGVSAQFGEPTLADHETVEVLVAWLAGRAGQDFLDACEKEIAKRMAAQRAEARARHDARLNNHQPVKASHE